MKPAPAPKPVPKHPAEFNIEAIAKLEHDFLQRRTIIERVSEAVTKFIGSIGFLLINVGFVVGWIAINRHLIPDLMVFDPFPFGILAIIISSESLVLTIFVLISQNRMTRQAERRSHLDLQVGMLAEQEMTTMLQMLQKVCQHLGVNVESAREEVEQFSNATDVQKLATELDEKLPDQ